MNNTLTTISRHQVAQSGKRAGFLAVDAMLSDKNAQELAGAVIFGTSGIALNLGQKAEAQDIKAIYVTQKAAR